MPSLVGSEMCIRNRRGSCRSTRRRTWGSFAGQPGEDHGRLDQHLALVRTDPPEPARHPGITLATSLLERQQALRRQRQKDLAAIQRVVLAGDEPTLDQPRDL